jgi:succinoglycan biosynthesis transport protein ExoP
VATLRPVADVNGAPAQSAASGRPGVETDDLRQLVRPVWDRKWLILFVVVLATVGSYLYYDRKPRIYQATSTIFVKTSDLESTLFGGSVFDFGGDRSVLNQATLLTTTDTARQVASRIGYKGDPRALLGGVSAKARSGQDFIDITARNNDPARAAKLANEFARAFIQLRSNRLRERVKLAERTAERQLAATPAGDRLTRETLSDRIRQLRAVEAVPAGTAEQITRAVTPSIAISPRPNRNALFALVMSFVLAVLGAYGLDRLDRRLRRLDDIESAYKLPLVGVLPATKDVAPRHNGRPVVSADFRESFRSLRTNIELVSLDRRTQMIATISSGPSEGKSTVIRNLALTYAEYGLRVAVVEGDVRRPSLSATFGVESKPGLTNVLAGETTIEQALGSVDLGDPESNGARPVAGSELERTAALGDITVLPSGPEPPNPPGVLGSDRMRDLLQELRGRFDIILIDTPPLLTVSDAVPLISAADGTLLVSRLNQTERGAAKRITQLLNRIPEATVLGIVANDVEQGELGGSYRYYGYGGPRRPPFWKRLFA